MKQLTRGQMKMVTGGDDFGSCIASCPPGQSAGCGTGVINCTFIRGQDGYDTGVDCFSDTGTTHVDCGTPQTTLVP